MDLSLLKRIGEALELDSNNKYNEAYVKYVECILSVATNLLKSVRECGGQVTSTREVSRYVQLGQQSFDRVATLLKIISDHSESSIQPTQKLSDPVPPLHYESSCHYFSLDKKKTLSPMKVAYKQNQQLMMAYRARMSTMKTRDSKTASLSLTIQRKMAENLAIAKAQEDALAKKMKERQLRLEEQASRRFAAPVGMSEEEQEQRQIYKKILEYEQEAKWLTEWRIKLDNQPLDTVLINQLMQEILRCVDHPLTKLVKDYQFKVYEKIYPLVSQSPHQLKDIVVPLPEYLHPPKVKERTPEDNRDIENSEISKDETLLNETVLDQKENTPSKEDIEIFPSDDDAEFSNSKESEVKRNVNNNDVSSDVKENSDLKNVSDHINKDLEMSFSKKSSQDLHAESSTDKTHTSTESELPVESSERVEPEPSCRGLTESEPTCSQLEEGKSSETSEHGSRSKDNQSRSENDNGRCENIDNKPASDDNLDSVSNSVGRKCENVSSTEDSDDRMHGNDSDTEDISDDGRFERNPKGFTGMAEKTKRDLEKAMHKGQTLQKQLTIELEKSQSLIVNFSKDYEQYNQENMDDLFEDDDDDDSSTGPDDGGDDDKDRQDISNKDDSYCINHTPSSDQSNKITSVISPADPPVISHPISISHSSISCPNSISRSLSTSISHPNSISHSLSTNLPISDAELIQLSEEAYHRHLKWISEDVHSYMEKLVVMFTIAYDKLESPTGRDVCYAALEELFFKSLWKYLLTLYRFANRSKETLLAYHMTICGDSTPSSFGVVDKLCLTPREGQETGIPYQSAVDELCRVQEHYTMLSKLECVVRVCRLVMTCVEEYYQADSSQKSPNVGADDLLPILSYLVIKSCLPQLVSECSAMSEFIHEGYIMGEEGYCLTSLQTAILHVASGRFGKK